MSSRLVTGIRAFCERIGALALDGVAGAIDLWRVFAGTLAGVVRGRRARGEPRGEIFRQMYAIGNKSLVFVAVTLGFIGMVMVYQSCLQLDRITGDLSMVGPQFIKLLVQDFGPTLTAMMLATRVGAGIAAEVGSMKVTEQIDALRMSGVRPIDYLVVPRFVASLVMTVVLSVFGTAVSYAAGGLTAWSSYAVNPQLFFDIRMVNFTHLALGLIKAVCYGMAIPVISGFCGLRARGSSEGVGWATTSAVIGSSFAVIVLDFVLSTLGMLVVGSQL